jgi:Tol biopolymer transport system component
MHSALSPDGRRVAFASNTTGQADIWVQNVDGADLRRLTNDQGADAWPNWTPDGRSIVFSAQDGNETRLVSADGGPSEKIIDGFFRGDLIAKPDGQGLLMVSNLIGGGLRVVDVDTRAILWQQRPLGNAMPSFSPDGSLISHPYREAGDRDAIWVYETATGKSRVAVRFAEPFMIFFRASWTDNGRAFVVNRYREFSHIVMFDRFWKGD